MKNLKLEEMGNWDMPEPAKQAFIRAGRAMKKIQRHYFPDIIGEADIADSWSEATLAGFEFITEELVKNPECKNWTKDQWYTHVIRRFQNAVLEYSKYVYLPVSIPRPLRFSLKKYAETIKIIAKYTRTLRHPSHSDLYYALCIEGCNPMVMTCTKCKCGLNPCPLLHLSSEDSKALYDLLLGPKKSLVFYAQWYRKGFSEWIRLLEILQMYTVSDIIPEIPISYDFDSALDLRKFERQLGDLHPSLYDIYTDSLDSLDLDELNNTLIIRTPYGWNSKQTKDRHTLTTQQYRDLLIKGDMVLNKFRVAVGLPRVFRDFQAKSPS